MAGDHERLAHVIAVDRQAGHDRGRWVARPQLPMPQPEAHNAVVRGEEQVAEAKGDAVSAAVEETHLLIGSPVTIAVPQREDAAGIGAVRSRIERNRTKKGKRIGGSKGGAFSPGRAAALAARAGRELCACHHSALRSSQLEKNRSA